MKFNTRLLHGRAVDRYPHGSTLPPIIQANAYRYDSFEELERVFSHKAMGYAYSRIGNPTVTAFERRINELEGGAGSVATASGMAAISQTLLTILSPGDEVLAAGLEVNHPSLDSHPDHELCIRELGGLGGGILTFRAGSRERAAAILNRLRYACIASNIGDVRTLVIYPSSTIFMKNTKEQREKAGVCDDTLRISVGIEDEEDLIEDFLNAIHETAIRD